MPLYELAVFGSPTSEQLSKLQDQLADACSRFRLTFGEDISLAIQPKEFRPDNRAAAAAIFFGGIDSVEVDISKIMDCESIAVLPVASNDASVATEIPLNLRRLNCLFVDKVNPDRIFSALLECVGLLPRQRRVFLSYRRNEATTAAVQLFSELSARQFDVFLDTQGIGPAVDFQETLWHQLCDVDVLIMLETATYFESRWTSAEYGRALAKGIGVLRVQWPDTTPSIHTGTASLVELVQDEIDDRGQLGLPAVERICSQLENVRSLSHATRHLSMVTAVQDAIEQVEGKIDCVGSNRSMYLTLRSGRKLVIQPTVGVPTSLLLQETFERARGEESAVVYDHFGLKRSWQGHMNWLAQKVPGTRWVKKTEAVWDFGGWEAM